MADINRDDIRRCLGLAVQILDDLPRWLRPASNMNDMRAILNGEDSGRDGQIIVQAVATALAWRSQQAITDVIGAGLSATAPEDRQRVYTAFARLDNRMQEFSALFKLVQLCDARTFAVYYNETCDRMARAHRKADGDPDDPADDDLDG
jgi:hypothetical protein